MSRLNLCNFAFLLKYVASSALLDRPHFAAGIRSNYLSSNSEKKR